VADGTGLLNPDPFGSRGFESHRLRFFCDIDLLLVWYIGSKDYSDGF
jgi:hypothetical protein